MLAKTSQPTQLSPIASLPRKNQPEQRDNVYFEDKIDLPRPNFSTAIDESAAEDDNFDLLPPRPALALDECEQTGRSIELARKATDNKGPGRLSRGNLGSIRADDQFDKASRVRIHDELQARAEDSLLPSVENYQDKVDSLGGYADTTSVSTMRARSQHELIWSRGDTENIRRAIVDDAGRESSSLVQDQANHRLHIDAGSPFILQAPCIEPWRPSSDIDDRPEPLLKQVDDLPELSGHESLRSNSHISQARSPNPVRKARTAMASNAFRISRHGIPYRRLPRRVTKNIASAFAREPGGRKSRINEETLSAIIEAGEDFFAQLSEDLGALAKHARRKIIGERDIIAAMKR